MKFHFLDYYGDEDLGETYVVGEEIRWINKIKMEKQNSFTLKKVTFNGEKKMH